MVVWDHHVCPDFDFLSCDDKSASGLHRKLSGAGRPDTETHDLEVTRVRGPELYDMVVFLERLFVDD